MRNLFTLFALSSTFGGVSARIPWVLHSLPDATRVGTSSPSSSASNPNQGHKLKVIGTPITPRGGGKPVDTGTPVDAMFDALGGIWSNPEVQMVADILHPTNLARAASNFLQEQSTAAQERRNYYQNNADEVAPYVSLFRPVRLLKLTLAAFLLSEFIEFVAGNESCQTFYSNTVKPMVSGSWKKVQAWWEKGREQGGLFSASTWSQVNVERKPQIIVQAWNRQFSPKYQRAMGTAVGLVLSPVLWGLTGILGKYAALAVVLAEINQYTGERLELALRKVSLSLSESWGKVDVALESLRRTVHNLVQKPWQVSQMLLADLDDKVPEEVLPMALQQGLALGVVIGFVGGV